MNGYDIISGALKDNEELKKDSWYLITLRFKENLDKMETTELGQAVLDIKRELKTGGFKVDRLWKHDPNTLLIIGKNIKNPVPLIAIGVIAVIVMVIGAYCLTLIDDNIHEIVMEAAPVTRNIAMGIVAALGGLLLLKR